MQASTEMPYWMRSIGRHLQRECAADRRLPFKVRLNMLHLVRVEGEMRLLHEFAGLF
jgi:hypothetical protein